MRRATMSILGLYNYDNTLLDNFQLPAEIDRNDFIINLLSETAQLEVAYPNPDVFKTILNSWSNTRVQSWNRMYKALYADYNPIHNFDRNEEFSDKVNTISSDKQDTRGSSATGDDYLETSTSHTVGKQNATGSDTVAHKGKQTEDGTDTTLYGKKNVEQGTETTQHSVAGFDSPDYEKDYKDSKDGSTSSTDSGEDVLSKTNQLNTEGSDVTTYGKQDGTDDQQDNQGKHQSTTGTSTTGATVNSGESEQITTHQAKLFGNIGVTKTQEMIEDEIKLRTQYDMNTIIINEVINRFCLLVY